MASRKNSKINPAKQAELRAIKSTLAKLKKKGVLAQNIDLRSYTPTKYMQRRVRELEGLLTGEKVLVKAPRNVAKKYRGTSGAIVTKKGVVVENQPGTIDMVKRGMLARITPLGGGYMQENIRLPVNVRNRADLIKWLDSGDIDRLKFPEEYLAFRMNGFASHRAVPNVEALRDYLYSYSVFSQDDEDEGGTNYDIAFLEFFRVYPPDAWEAQAKREQEAYRATPEYQAKLKRQREKRAARRAIKRSKEIVAKREQEKSDRQQERFYAATIKRNKEKRENKGKKK